MTECIACGENKSDKVDMLAGIKKALEYEGDWTRLEGGVLECGLRDQFDGEQTGLARIIVDDGKVSVAAWSDNPYEYKTMPEPDWTHEYNPADPEAIAEDIWYRCPFCGQAPNKCWCEEERCSECGAFLDDAYEGDLGYCLNCH